MVAVVAAAAVAVASGGSDSKQPVAAGSAAISSSPAQPTTTTTAAAQTLTKANFNTTYTVTSVNQGPSLSSGATVGNVTTSTAVVECDATTCTFTAPESRFDKGFLALTYTRTGDHFEAARVDHSTFTDQCEALNETDISSTIDFVRDATGKVTGFTGTHVIVHPGGVESADGKCATEDITSTFVGTLA